MTPGIVAFLADFPALADVVAGDRVRNYELLTQLARQGFRVRVFVLDRGSASAWHAEPNIEVLPLPEPGPGIHPDERRARVMLRCLRETARDWRAQAISPIWLYHKLPTGIMLRAGWLPVHGNPASLLYPWARRLGILRWTTLHDLSPDHELATFARAVRSGVVTGREDAQPSRAFRRSLRIAAAEARWVVRNSELVTCVSTGMRDALVARFGARSESVVVAPTGANPDIVEPLHTWNVPEQRPWRVGYIGSVRDVALATLAAAVAHARHDAPYDIELVVCADSASSRAIAQAGAIPMAGFKYADFPAFASSIDIWLNSYDETDEYMKAMASPIKIPMYLASSRPLVCPGMPFLERDGFLRHVIPAARPSDMGSAIVTIVRDPTSAKARARESRNAILATRTWRHTTDSLLPHLLVGGLTSGDIRLPL